MEKIDLEKLKKQLLSRVDTDDLLEIKKINNLIRLYELDAKCDEIINQEGVRIIIENGKQRFIKSHPSMNEKMKINAQIIALEKSIKFKMKVNKEVPPSATSSVESKDERGGLI
ncbi:MAG: terminase [Niallia sp.]